jgi:hypothetical protein
MKWRIESVCRKRKLLLFLLEKSQNNGKVWTRNCRLPLNPFESWCEICRKYWKFTLLCRRPHFSPISSLQRRIYIASISEFEGLYQNPKKTSFETLPQVFFPVDTEMSDKCRSLILNDAIAKLSNCWSQLKRAQLVMFSSFLVIYLISEYDRIIQDVKILLPS